jgi:hypothetical protein
MALLLGPAATLAHADPLTIPGYTVTDLGYGTTTFSTEANGTGVLNAPNGQIYAFAQTDNTVLTPGQGILANAPLPTSAIIDGSGLYGNGANTFGYIQSAVMNANGIIAATDDWGIEGRWAFGSAYFLQINANGSLSPSSGLWTSNIIQDEPFIYSNVITGLNNLNQILGSVGVDPTRAIDTDAVLYNVNSHTLTDLTQLFASSSTATWLTRYNGLQPIALDNDGRILVSASAFNPNIGGWQTNLLLTPNGLSASPLEVPAPEPGTLAVMLLAIAGFAAHRVRERRR